MDSNTLKNYMKKSGFWFNNIDKSWWFRKSHRFVQFKENSNNISLEGHTVMDCRYRVYSKEGVDELTNRLIEEEIAISKNRNALIEQIRQYDSLAYYYPDRNSIYVNDESWNFYIYKSVISLKDVYRVRLSQNSSTRKEFDSLEKAVEYMRKRIDRVLTKVGCVSKKRSSSLGLSYLAGRPVKNAESYLWKAISEMPITHEDIEIRFASNPETLHEEQRPLSDEELHDYFPKVTKPAHTCLLRGLASTFTKKGTFHLYDTFESKQKENSPLEETGDTPVKFNPKMLINMGFIPEMKKPIGDSLNVDMTYKRTHRFREMKISHNYVALDHYGYVLDSRLCFYNQESLKDYLSELEAEHLKLKKLANDVVSEVEKIDPYYLYFPEENRIIIHDQTRPFRIVKDFSGTHNRSFKSDSMFVAKLPNGQMKRIKTLDVFVKKVLEDLIRDYSGIKPKGEADWNQITRFGLSILRGKEVPKRSVYLNGIFHTNLTMTEVFDFVNLPPKTLRNSLFELPKEDAFYLIDEKKEDFVLARTLNGLTYVRTSKREILVSENK